MAGSSQALAVSIDTISGFPPNTFISIPDLEVSGTTDEHGDLDVKITCTEGQSFDIIDKDGRPLPPFICSPTSTYLSTGGAVIAVVGIAAGIVANAGGGDGTAAPAGNPVDPGPFGLCTVEIPGNGPLVASGTPTSFSTSPVTLFGNPSHVFTIFLNTGTGFGGGVQIEGSVAGFCTDACTAGGTVFPLTLNCPGNGCGFTSFAVTDCTPGVP